MDVKSLDDNYYQMAKQSQENSRMKVFSSDNTVSTVNYLHGVESSKINYGRNFNRNNTS
jgi:hypothetical protein